ncbi:hypothetical protein PI124_g9732 [Phytophthora idaei]|nr:hypothetical protein PI125_g9491 [Phytophthora idaei]KAG3156546.1 hypothetical protein PI126_g8720 [Phytophthora idaei]KAG3245523.1 hypothetical protein PI124_g9732 [Phytophthora idaei]
MSTDTQPSSTPGDTAQVAAAAVNADAVRETAAPMKHSATLVDEWRNHSGQSKRVQRNCKVCALQRKDGKRGGTTSYCDACFDGRPVYLCMKSKKQLDGDMKRCWGFGTLRMRTGR